MLLGRYVAEGSSVASNWTVSITNADQQVLELAAQLISEHFAVEPSIQTGYGRCGSTRLASKRFIEWLDFIGAGRTAYEKRIPPTVLEAPRHTAIAFLRGLALDGYTTLAGRSPRWAICVASGGLLDDLQVLLTRLGIVHSRIEKWNAEYRRAYGEVYVSGRHAPAMIRLTPFLEADKAARAAPLLELKVAGGAWDAGLASNRNVETPFQRCPPSGCRHDLRAEQMDKRCGHVERGLGSLR
jgi:intein/homing endonuclease